MNEKEKIKNDLTTINDNLNQNLDDIFKTRSTVKYN